MSDTYPNIAFLYTTNAKLGPKLQVFRKQVRVIIVGLCTHEGNVYVEAVSDEVIEISTVVAKLYFEAIIAKKVKPVMYEVM